MASVPVFGPSLIQHPSSNLKEAALRPSSPGSGPISVLSSRNSSKDQCRSGLGPTNEDEGGSHSPQRPSRRPSDGSFASCPGFLLPTASTAPNRQVPVLRRPSDNGSLESYSDKRPSDGSFASCPGFLLPPASTVPNRQVPVLRRPSDNGSLESSSDKRVPVGLLVMPPTLDLSDLAGSKEPHESSANNSVQGESMQSSPCRTPRTRSFGGLAPGRQPVLVEAFTVSSLKSPSRSFSFMHARRPSVDSAQSLASSLVELVTLARSRVASVSRRYLCWYVTYLVLVNTICALVIWGCEDRELPITDCFLLAISSSTGGGLTPVDFGRRPVGTVVTCWVCSVTTSAMLMSIWPVILRIVYAEVFGKRACVALLGLRATKTQEGAALRILASSVVAYWFGMQAIGWALIWMFYELNGKTGYCWKALFLATTCFHNCGMVPLEEGLHVDQTGVNLTMMFLIMVGNTWFPIVLRMCLQVWTSCTRNEQRKAVLRLLLKYPRTLYTHLFPDYVTIPLCIVTVGLIVMQVVAMYLADLLAHGNVEESERLMADFTWSQRLMGILLVSVSSRTGGVSVLDLSQLSPSSAYVICAAMWISTCPVSVAMRSTTWNRSDRIQTFRTSDSVFEKTRAQVRTEFSHYMMQDTGWLALLFFGILIVEEANTSWTDVRGSRFLPIWFEFCSAYGTSGLSMSSAPWSECANWSPISKWMLMMVMMMGRLRGLPSSIEPTVKFALDEDWCESENDRLKSEEPRENRQEQEDKLSEKGEKELEFQDCLQGEEDFSSVQAECPACTTAGKSLEKSGKEAFHSSQIGEEIQEDTTVQL